MNLSAKVTIIEKEDSALKGIATLVIEQCFVVKGITIFEGKNGYFCSMPSKKVNDTYRDICYPITAEFRNEITSCILEEYEKELTKKKNNNSNSDLPF